MESDGVAAKLLRSATEAVIICAYCRDVRCKNINEHCRKCGGVNTEWIEIDACPYIYCRDCEDY